MASIFVCRVSCLALLITLTAAIPAGRAQTNTAQTPPVLDPESPMAPMTDIGVDWPEITNAPQSPAPAQSPPEDSAKNDNNLDALRYSVAIEGLDVFLRASLKTRFDELSALKAGQGAPANAAQIDRRARDDADVLTALLKNDGYYDAITAPEVERQAGGTLIVRLIADAGTRYSYADVKITGLENLAAKADRLRSAFGVATRDPVVADAVIAGQSALLAQVKREGLPFAKIGNPEITVDHDSKTATLALAIIPGGERRFGQFVMIGNRAPFGAKHVAQIARFKSGAVYDQSGLDDLKRALIATGLASSVTVSAVPGEVDDIADVAVSLEPAPLRTIAGEIGYGTGEGIRLTSSWTNRNLLPPEGAVTVRGVLGTREQLFGAILRQGNFGKRDQVLNGRIEARRSNFSAFKASTFEIAAGIERQSNIIWQKRWTYSAGVELITSDERDLVGASITRRRTFFVGAVPLTLNYDASNDLLDPTRGFRIGLRASPEISLQGGAFGYVRAQLDGSLYVPATPRVTIAGRARFGSIAGAKSDAIAPSRRFYAGGGGSIRGYGFQQIGPRDIQNDPDGGRSIAEFAIEARIRLGSFGVVPFIDAGNIYSGALPDFSKLRYGAGVGLRYHSNFGPIRIDVGTPINPQKGDTRVTVFVSLGQAF